MDHYAQAPFLMALLASRLRRAYASPPFGVRPGRVLVASLALRSELSQAVVRNSMMARLRL